MSESLVIVIALTCWAMGATAGWVVGHRRVVALATRVQIQQEVIDGMSKMLDRHPSENR